MRLNIFGIRVLPVLALLFSAVTQIQSACKRDCVPNTNDYTCKRLFKSGELPFQAQTEKNLPCQWAGMEGKDTWCCSSEQAYADQMTKIRVTEILGALGGADINEYPHQIKLVGVGGDCGGTVYNKDWVITAAHCIRYNGTIENNVEEGYLIAGKTDVADVEEEDKFKFKNIIVHEQWNEYDIGLGHDIALLELARELPLQRGKIQPLRVEPENFEPTYGGKAIAMGFGVASEYGVSNYLMEAEVPIHEPSKAARLSFDPTNAPKSSGGTLLLPEHLAVAGDDSGYTVGQGDSGGPAICADHNGKPVLCGIASFKSCDLKKVCRRPSFFVRVAPLLEWIAQKTGNAEQPEDLLVDEPMIPMKLERRDVPGYLVRLQSHKQSCGGTLITPKKIITSHECISTMTNGNLSDIANSVNIYHYKSGKMYAAIGSMWNHEHFQRDISANISKYMHRPLGLNDAFLFVLGKNVEKAEVLELPPPGYSIQTPAVEYTMNEKAFGVQTRRYMPMDPQLCQKKLNALDKNLELHTSHLCMQRVYSAEADCERDIAGPLVCGDKYFCGFKTFEGCGLSGFPKIFNNHLDKTMARWLKSARNA